MQLKLENVTPSRTAYKPRYIFYGPNGYGKSAFANEFPLSLFIDMEKNLGHLKTITHEDIGGNFNNLTEFLQLVKELEKQEKLPFKTFILDTIDKFEEKIIKPQICLEEGVDCIESIPWGRGVGKLTQCWSQVFAALEHLSVTKNIIVILIGHECLDKATDTENNITYPTKRPHIHEKSLQNLLNWSTCILYIAPNFKMAQKVADNSLGIPKEKKVSTIYASPDAGFVAKNQYGIVHPMPLNFEVFYEKVTNFYKKEVEK